MKSAAFFDDMSRTLENMDMDKEEDRMSIDLSGCKGDQDSTNN